jgi:enoyl-CoA hydratase/carnithine racemase
VRAVILRSGLARRFCAGLDLTRLGQQTNSELRTVVEKLYVRICEAQFNLGKPSIAAVNGTARGGGMTLAISCDLIVASRSATFGYPEIDVGLIPAIHFTHLPRIVGRYRAFDLLFSGRSFGVDEADQLGLVSRIFDDADLLDGARELARTLAAKSPQIVALARAEFLRANDRDYRRSVAHAVDAFCAVAATPQALEGVKAFVEKRKPNWSRS